MCRTLVERHVEAELGALLAEIRRRLAEDAGVPEESVTIGPVDFGPEVENFGPPS